MSQCRAVKTELRNDTRYYHCHEITKHTSMTSANFVFRANSCLMYKITHDRALEVLLRSTEFGQSAFSIRATIF